MDVKNAINKTVSFESLVDKIKESCYELDKSFYQDKANEYFVLEANSLMEDYKRIEELVGNFCIILNLILISL